MSNITVVGNVSSPDVKSSRDGKQFFTFSLAENHRKKNSQTGEWENANTTWRRVTYFGSFPDQVEALAENVEQGARVIVEGREELREYAKDDGTKGYSLDVVANTVGVVPKAKQGGQGGGNFQQPQQSPQGNQWGQAPQWGNQPQGQWPQQGGQ